MNKFTRRRMVVALAAVSIGAWGLTSLSRAEDKPAEHEHKMAEHHHEHMWEAVTEAIAVIHPTEGHTVHGVVHFTQEGDKVKVVADLEGLTPAGKHGFHVHEFGDCSSADGSSAGGHYNPEKHEHAGPDTGERHAGDLGNIEADADGKAHYELTVDNISIAGMKDPIIGRSVIVHEKVDDLKTQPTGNAGGRIGCGVIGIAKAAAPATQPAEKPK